MQNIKDYILRITNASPAELTIINYDILLDSIADAIKSRKNDSQFYVDSVNRARDSLMELIGALNMDIAISREIYPLYMRVNMLLISSLVYEKEKYLTEAEKIIFILREGWVKVRDSEPQGGKVFIGAPKVYSGLTYGRKGLNDYVDDDGESGRGIRV